MPIKEFKTHRQIFFVCLTITCIGVFYIVTLRQGHSWGDDFALYILHAKNIAHGLPYADTGFIYNPFGPSTFLGPSSYPPGFPILLAPAIFLFGINLTAMKVEGILFFLGALGLFGAWWKKSLRLPLLVTLLLGIGCNPYFWDFKDNILSDLPFLFITYLGVLCIQHMTDGTKRVSWAFSLFTGFLLYAAYATRSVGIVLPATLFTTELIVKRRLTMRTCMALLACGLGILLQNILLRTDASYLRTFQISDIVKNVDQYSAWLLYIWDNGYRLTVVGRIVRAALTVILTLFSIWGFVVRVRRPSSMEIFGVVYMAVLMVSPVREIRYLIPIFPLYMGYALLGMQYVWEKRETRWHVWALVILVFASYAAKYTTLPWGTLPEGVGTVRAQELFSFVRSTPPQSTFVFLKPRALALFGERKSTTFHTTTSDEELWSYWRRVHATHIVVLRHDKVTKVDSRAGEMREFAQEYSPRFLTSVFANDDFEVYSITFPPVMLHEE